MATFSTDQLDLNLLRTLIVLLEEKNTHRVAERLDISQPSVSRALAKLREQLNDPLFFREKRGLRLSARAESLAHSLPEAFDALLQTLEPEHFDPGMYQGNLKIVVNTFLAETYGRNLYQKLKQQAPGAELELFSWGDDTCGLIESGQIHAALSYTAMNLPQTFVQCRVGRDLFGLMGRKELSILQREVEDHDLSRYPVAGLINPPVNSRTMPLRKSLAKRGIHMNVAIRSQHLRPLLEVIEEEDVLMLAPEKLAEKLGERFAFARFRSEPEASFADICMIYSGRNRYSPMFEWLEKNFIELFS
ncbi:LysR family transcriptional regulator [Parendozoicomonas sp. Alg238-R29]|uniref:LysR family transcriptional regulator n=1 Tax=Parendozoicomonas sp. Alg238-R29 TaxID=2993446 RepID=UPI00248DF160|nr:LysR family transcriptional regulator [Parendozoicomonas sp. Alg238-R29]